MTEQVEARTLMVPGYGPETAKLVEVLEQGQVGDILTDETLEAVCGRATSPSGNGYSNLQSAIRKVERDKGIVWQRERGAGCIRCLNDKEKAGCVGRDIKHIRKTAKRAAHRAAGVTLDNLEVEERKRMLVNAAQVGAIALVSETNTRKKLENRDITLTPDPKQLLAAFVKTKQDNG